MLEETVLWIQTGHPDIVAATARPIFRVLRDECGLPDHGRVQFYHIYLAVAGFIGTERLKCGLVAIAAAVVLMVFHVFE